VSESNSELVGSPVAALLAEQTTAEPAVSSCGSPQAIKPPRTGPARAWTC